VLNRPPEPAKENRPQQAAHKHRQDMAEVSPISILRIIVHALSSCATQCQHCTTDHQANGQQHERPGCCRDGADPTKGEHRASNVGTATEPISPDADRRRPLVSVTLAGACGSLPGHLPAKSDSLVALNCRIISHAATPQTTIKRFHLRDRCANAPFFFVQHQKFTFHCVMELAEVRTADGMANGDAHIRTSFYEHPFINGEIDRSILFGS